MGLGFLATMENPIGNYVKTFTSHIIWCHKLIPNYYFNKPHKSNNKPKSIKGKLLGVIVNGDSHYAIAHRLIDWTMKLG